MIGADIVAAVAELVGTDGPGEAVVARLRARWPQLRFTHCSDDDVPPRLTPAFSGEGYRLYYVAGGDHCLALTRDAEAAIGLVVAEVVED